MKSSKIRRFRKDRVDLDVFNADKLMGSKQTQANGGAIPSARLTGSFAVNVQIREMCF